MRKLVHAHMDLFVGPARPDELTGVECRTAVCTSTDTAEGGSGDADRRAIESGEYEVGYE
jgi:hypothetical protein